MRRKFLIAALMLTTGIAIACTNYEFVGELHVGSVSSRDDVGEELMEDFGDQFPVGTRIEAVVRFQLRINGVTIGTFSMPLVKECDETLEEAYAEQIDEDSTSGTGGAGSGGGIYTPTFPNIPGGCIGNCGGIVEVGDVEQA